MRLKKPKDEGAEGGDKAAGQFSLPFQVKLRQYYRVQYAFFCYSVERNASYRQSHVMELE